MTNLFLRCFIQHSDKQKIIKKYGRPDWGALFAQSAAIAAAAVVVSSVAATAAEQQNQNDDPPAVVATEAVVVTHKNTSK